MAQFILRKKLKQEGLTNIDVYSFGLNVTEKKINDNAVKALQALNVKRTKFTPKQLQNPGLYDALITMTTAQKGYVNSPKSNVYSISELTGTGDIQDPYGCGVEKYIAVATQLDSACNEIIKLLRRL